MDRNKRMEQAAMDKKIKKKRFTVKKVAMYLGIALFVGFVGYQFIFADRRQTLIVDREKITISDVNRGIFQETIPQTGTVEPKRTVFLDAIEGGNIKRIVKESGAMVKKGDEIIELTNLNRELTVLGQEAQLNESISRQRQNRLELAQNDLRQLEALAAIDNQLAVLKPQYERNKKLFEKNLIARQDFEKVEADYKYNVKRRDFTYEAYRIDSIDRVRQLKQINESEAKMLQNLQGVSLILDNLTIRAPIDGQLSTPVNWEIGQSINQGQRLGQIDILGIYKVSVPIDELYLPRISKGLRATTDFNNKTYSLVITYIYPTITGGRFLVDMDFVGDAPQGLRRGLSLRMRIELGQSAEGLLLPVGGFYKDTGGNWVFVVEPGGDRAVKRDIKLGRKNPEHFEVLEGLKPGDKVITSSYENFGTNEVLILN